MTQRQQWFMVMTEKGMPLTYAGRAILFPSTEEARRYAIAGDTIEKYEGLIARPLWDRVGDNDENA
jgi:hypothetical protein